MYKEAECLENQWFGYLLLASFTEAFSMLISNAVAKNYHILRS